MMSAGPLRGSPLMALGLAVGRVALQHGRPDTGLGLELSGAGRRAGREMRVSLKVLQMKVMRLEHLVQLKDQRIGELTRRRTEPQ